MVVLISGGPSLLWHRSHWVESERSLLCLGNAFVSLGVRRFLGHLVGTALPQTYIHMHTIQWLQTFGALAQDVSARWRYPSGRAGRRRTWGWRNGRPGARNLGVRGDKLRKEGEGRTGRKRGPRDCDLCQLPAAACFPKGPGTESMPQRFRLQVTWRSGSCAFIFTLCPPQASTGYLLGGEGGGWGRRALAS